MAHDVLEEGTEISRNMRDLSQSLRNNAERLLRDVRLAHGGMTAALDQVAPSAKSAPGAPRRKGRVGSSREEDGPSEDLDVPEFIPRG